MPSRFIALTFALFLALPVALVAAAAVAQGTNVAFGGLKADTRLPVEVTSENLTVDQTDGSATFAGDVLVKQGEMRIEADSVRVEYDTTGKAIARLHASGGVLVVNATDAAQAESAVYTIASGEVVMTGNVLLTQGQATIRGAALVINLQTGTGRIEGGVTTTFTPGGN
ncbi:lipopolysaccharide transport periplasmic protein LptA [Tabrizicola sp.]|uniref:lipopolysaccharide transport periplasmic protein LptA n=1 Tax=Tabrizicola sp. TaxID=2005166 RepID=UPI003D2A0625